MKIGIVLSLSLFTALSLTSCKSEKKADAVEGTKLKLKRVLLFH